MLLTSSCVAGVEDENTNTPRTETSTETRQETPPSEEAQTPIASSFSSATPEGANLKFDIFSLERHSEEVLVLNLGVTNTGDRQANVFQSLSELGGEPTTPDGVTLIDTVNNKRHMPLKLTDGETCHCSNWRGEEKLAPGDSIVAWAAFPSTPSNIERVTVTTPVTPDFLDIPITDTKDKDSTIADTPTAEPSIIDIRSFHDEIDSGNSRSNSGDETTVILSSDVLFDTNKADLTADADASLQNLAQEIDNSSTAEVKIDGYTDNTGNDSINIPLSEARAESVKERLSELVTRSGVAFETAGHGSASPVGDNSSQEGRQKNRRVTVTFTR
ncbi:OmpA family protein [Marinactinospora thermotolerans]|uniref:OmpA family protein n=1 Tax=Marinactinospora thermotolerans TaxID=531310 RepID=UPI003D91D17A